MGTVCQRKHGTAPVQTGKGKSWVKGVHSTAVTSKGKNCVKMVQYCTYSRSQVRGKCGQKWHGTVPAASHR